MTGKGSKKGRFRVGSGLVCGGSAGGKCRPGRELESRGAANIFLITAFSQKGQSLAR